MPKTRLQKTFLQLQQKQQKAFVPFTVLGDPDLPTSAAIIKTYLASGADMLELGLPFSDPVADGPVIQAADQRALNNKPSLNNIFKLLKNIRSQSEVPISILTYANLPFSFGIEKFYAKLQESGVDAILIADLPLEEANSYLSMAKKYNIHQVFLVHEKTTLSRLQKINRVGSGYLYLVSQSSTTGIKKEISPQLQKTIKFFKKHSPLPVLVGFGISEASQITTISEAGADGVIIGSKLVKVVSENLQKPKKMLSQIKETMLYLRHATR